MEIYVNSRKIDVKHNNISDFVIYSSRESEKKAEIRIILDEEVRETRVRPQSVGITPILRGKEITFDADIPCKLDLEFPGSERLPIFFFLYGREEVPQGENVRYFAPGEYTLDEIRIASNETLYIAEGAIVHAHLYAENAENLTVCGRGVLDVEGDITTKHRRMARFHECKNLVIRDVTLQGPKGWTCALFGCENVLIDNVNIMSWYVCGDGVDVVGSHDVTVKSCFIRTEDDCVSLKATDYCGPSGLRDVYNVKVSGCVFWNAQPGNAIEIGFETRCDEMYNIEFSDIDIIHCEHEGWQSGSAISIHNGDRAKIHDIVYRDIRIEDVCDKLFDFKIMYSRYSRDEIRGSIKNILAENISITEDAFPPSVISGFQADESLVENVRFVNLSVHGQMIKNLTECRMVCERAKNVSFEIK